VWVVAVVGLGLLHRLEPKLVIRSTVGGAQDAVGVRCDRLIVDWAHGRCRCQRRWRCRRRRRHRRCRRVGRRSCVLLCRLQFYFGQGVLNNLSDPKFDHSKELCHWKVVGWVMAMVGGQRCCGGGSVCYVFLGVALSTRGCEVQF